MENPRKKNKRRFAPISSPTLDLEEKYGGKWTRWKVKTLPDFQPLRMTSFQGKNHCSLSSITAVFYYYRKMGFSAIPDRPELIFKDVESYAQSHILYHPKIGTPFVFIDNIAQGLWASYGYGGTASNQIYFHGQHAVEDAIIREIDALRPAILSFTSRLYRCHSVTLYGYAIYRRERGDSVYREEDYASYALVNDNWSVYPHYMEISRMGHIEDSYFCLTRVFP